MPMTKRSQLTALTAYYGTIDAMENAGVAYRLFGEVIVTDAGVNIAVNLRTQLVQYGA